MCWTIQAFERYYNSLCKHSQPFVASVTHHCMERSCLRHKFIYRWLWEGIVKFLYAVVGIIILSITAFDGGQLVHYDNVQYIVMLSVMAFLLYSKASDY
jgi:hypothetical protein